MPMQPGRLIVLEGLDGSGKTTFTHALHLHLQKRLGAECVHRFREPGGTELGEVLRTLLLDVPKTPREPIHLLPELLLFSAARAQLLEAKIRPALQLGHWVLLDRYYFSTLANQVGGRQMDEPAVRALCNLVVGDLKGDLIFYLSISPELSERRCFQRGRPLDRMKAEGPPYRVRLHQAYERFIRLFEPDLPIVRMDGSLPKTELLQGLIEEISRRFPEVGPLLPPQSDRTS